MPEGLVIDSTAEAASNVQVDLFAAPIFVKEIRTPTPPLQPRWAEPADADGEVLAASRYQNREITVELEIVPAASSRPSPTAAAQASLASLADKVAKINREGGTLRRTMSSGDVFTFDLLTADSLDPPWDIEWDLASALKVTLKFTAKPFARGGTEVSYSSHSETTLPVLIFTETGPRGDVPALGRLVLTDASGNDQQWVVWGLQSRYYDPAATAALFYEAEGLTPMGTAAVATVTGASGGARNNAVTESFLTTDWSAILSTQTRGGGAHLTHAGDYRVFARVLPLPGHIVGTTMHVALEWALGDFFGYTRNASVAYGDSMDVSGTIWQIADLGIVSIPEDVTQWEGRIAARSSNPGDDLSVDCIWFVPVDRSGESSGVIRDVSPSVYVARDTFEQSAGALNAKTLPVGGAWATSGATTDLAVETTGKTAQRSTTGDAATRRALAGTSTPSGVVVSCDMKTTVVRTNGLSMAALARVVDSSNYVTAGLISNSAGDEFVLANFVSATLTMSVRAAVTIAANTWFTVRLLVTAGGVAIAALEQASGITALTFWHGSLATGGTLASGKAGFEEANSSGTAMTRNYNNFRAWVPPVDAAIFANRSVQFAHDVVTRRDAAGSFWSPAAYAPGDRLYVPPAGPENRTLRVIAKASRCGPGISDPAVDDLTGQLHVTPRFLVVP